MTVPQPVTDERLDSAPLTLAEGLFAGRVVLVSGGGSGIGKAAAWSFGRAVGAGRGRLRRTRLAAAGQSRRYP
jgi:hypothetical protein